MQLAAGDISLTKILFILEKDKLFLILFVIFLYLLVQPFFLELFSLVIAPTAKGVIRGSVIMPMVAYLSASEYRWTKNQVKMTVAILLLIGALHAVAIIYPAIFPNYMIQSSYHHYESIKTLQEGLNEGIRPSGFWDRSTQAATFMTIIICLSVAFFMYSKSRLCRLVTLLTLALSIVALSATSQRIQFVASSVIIFIAIIKTFTANRKKSNSQIVLASFLFLLFIFLNAMYPFIFISRDVGIQSISSDYRTEVVWPSYIKFIIREPSVLFFGAGFVCDALDEFGKPMYLMHAHNEFLGWIASTGFLISGLYIYAFIIYYRRARLLSYSKNESIKLFSSFAKFLLISLFIICLAESPMQQEPIAILVFFIAGMISSLYYSESSNPS